MNNPKPRRTDRRGKVVVKVFLAGKRHKPIKGNMIRTLSVDNGKVSEVHSTLLDYVAQP